jgi:hypothetical protein
VADIKKERVLSLTTPTGFRSPGGGGPPVNTTRTGKYPATLCELVEEDGPLGATRAILNPTALFTFQRPGVSDRGEAARRCRKRLTRAH